MNDKLAPTVGEPGLPQAGSAGSIPAANTAKYIFTGIPRRRPRKIWRPEGYDTPEWEALREEVLEEADYICRDCGGVAETVHHKSYREGIICRKSLLVALCWPCHKGRHGQYCN